MGDGRPIDVEAKRGVREKQKLMRKENRDHRRREWRCFWSLPKGHAWEFGPYGVCKTCVGCGKSEWA